MYDYLDKLNDSQREAVTTTEGAVLVLAGAGSGKTTVLANRIAYILQTRYTQPWNILAITFTNKAANEMKSRIEKIVGNGVNDMWVGTFHSICVRILRRYIELEGYGRDFVIYDSADSRTVMKECLKEMELDDKEYPVNHVLRVISDAKNALWLPEDMEREAPRDRDTATIAALYKRYRKKLVHNNALDFDDLIMLAVRILKKNPEVAEHYRAQFHYILVDEYQDTNNLQYELIKILSSGYGNVCVVGDDDQSIYRFRGANVNNILDFEKDYEKVKRVPLEQNYRSTQIILDAANGVIANNRKRLGKNLWTSRGDGEKISLFVGATETDEARLVVNAIKKQYKSNERYNDCAILYRTNAQSRPFEDVFMTERIPYKVLAGLRFYDRKEIKDIIAYLRLIYNYNDDLSLQRIINEPKRKIGAATMDKVVAHAQASGASLFEIINSADTYPELGAAAVRLKAFATLIKNLRTLAAELDITELVKRALMDSGYMDMLNSDTSVEAQTRIENIDEFINVVEEFKNAPDTTGGLGEFLENITLRSDADDYDESEDYVTLMTVHSAKGLEFPVVFVTGLEEGVFPGMRAGIDPEEMEEERRLCYVAITRAKDKLYLSRAESRFRYGTRSFSPESRFLNEIPHKLIVADGPLAQRAKQGLGRMGISIEAWQRETEHRKKKTEAAAVLPKYIKGDRVRHKKFGDGTVISAQPVGNDAILVIDFDTAGVKRLMAVFARLEKI
ncbi:MAG: UvrD-helicase domain-containing protein [Clostridia bacterium]|nr:UvrD-helicase domain-containing protein [Clostridia bacterium]